jgi:hypothetical protein
MERGDGIRFHSQIKAIIRSSPIDQMADHPRGLWIGVDISERGQSMTPTVVVE